MLTPFMAEEAVLIVPGDLEAKDASNQLHYVVNTISQFMQKDEHLWLSFPLIFSNSSSLLDLYIICDWSIIYLENTLVIHCI